MFKQTDLGVEVAIYVQPNSSKTQVIGKHNGQLKIKIKAPPLDGKANTEVIEFFSKLLKIPKKRIHLLKGEKSREKKILIEGTSLKSIQEIFGNLVSI